MISLPCTHCQKVLTIDEAFAGGVCRCQHCGTIQTVPAQLKTGDSRPGPPGKTLYRQASRSDSHIGTGLQHLHDNPPKPSERKTRGKRAADPIPVSAPEAPRSGGHRLIIAIIAAALVVVAVAVYILVHGT